MIIIGAGGGLIKPMQSRWESMLNRAETESANVRAQARTSSASSAPSGVAAAEAYPSERAYTSAPTGRTVASSDDAPTATYGTSTRR